MTSMAAAVVALQIGQQVNIVPIVAAFPCLTHACMQEPLIECMCSGSTLVVQLLRLHRLTLQAADAASIVRSKQVDRAADGLTACGCRCINADVVGEEWH